MGNGNSRKSQASTSPSPSTSSRVTSSFSFLSRKSDSVRSTSKIVVVNPTPNAVPFSDPNDDEDLRRIREVPKFMPILGVYANSSLQHESLTTIDQAAIQKFFQCIQRHSDASSQIISAEQGRVLAHVIQTDRSVLALYKQLSLYDKELEHLVVELKGMRELCSQISTLKAMTRSLIPKIEELNELLPESQRLPPISQYLPVSLLLEGSKCSDSSTTTSPSRTEIQQIKELKVIDWP